MTEIEEILSLPADEAVARLRRKAHDVPPWAALRRSYEPELHRIVRDRVGRRDKTARGGVVEPASRIRVGVERLLTRRMAELMFAIPVQRNYSNADADAAGAEVARALERVFRVARIDSENTRRAGAYFASCEACTVWYAVPKRHGLYGFPANFKLRCASYSPMDGYELLPLLDEYGDMGAMSLAYTRREGGRDVAWFETYTADRHIKWRLDGRAVVALDERNALGKIPCVYIWRPRPIYDGVELLREEIEYTLSRNSDVVAYNAAPILKVSGALSGVEDKGESRRIVKVESGGDVSYVSWGQAAEAVKWHVDEMFRLIFMQTQIPDISFDNLSHLGAVGYDARKTLLTDAHLKVGDESGPVLEFLDREVSVVKAFLKLLRPEWAGAVDATDVENIITPYIQDDETQNIQRLLTGNGGRPVFSQLESIRLAGYSTDPQATLDQINKEAAEAQAAQMQGLMAGGSYQ